MMTKYYSKLQVIKMFEAPAKFYSFEKVADDYLEAEFKDEPSLEIDDSKNIVVLSDDDIEALKDCTKYKSKLCHEHFADDRLLSDIDHGCEDMRRALTPLNKK